MIRFRSLRSSGSRFVCDRLYVSERISGDDLMNLAPSVCTSKDGAIVYYQEAAVDVPPGLGERGYARWQAMATPDVPRTALVLAAPRTADRLHELDNIIQGKGVLNLMQSRALDREVDDDGSVNINVEVRFNAVMAEARQHAVAFSNILTKLSPADSKAAAAPAPVPTNLPSNVSPLQRLTQSNPYKVVRPGWLDYNQPDLRRIVMLQGDRRQSGSRADGVIARDQIARVLIDTLKIDAADHKSLELIADHKCEQDDLTPVFTALAPDSDGSPDAAKDIVGLPPESEPDMSRDDLATITAESLKAGD